ncbi:MAG: type II toxin-antitoxin system VapC family toxin [Sulfolobales archaeon]
MSLIDTSVLIDNIRRGVYEEGAISIITLIEVLRGLASEKRRRVKELLERSYDVIYLDNKVILKYCELYDELKQKGLLMSDADLLIAATALTNNMVLVTKDRDFERLKNVGLRLDLRT